MVALKLAKIQKTTIKKKNHNEKPFKVNNYTVKSQLKKLKR